jgi:hypothetical protein
MDRPADVVVSPPTSTTIVRDRTPVNKTYIVNPPTTPPPATHTETHTNTNTNTETTSGSSDTPTTNTSTTSTGN